MNSKLISQKITLGLNDKITLRQKHFKRWYIKNIFKMLDYLNIEGCTLTESLGYYRMDDGRQVKEKSINLEFFDVNEVQIKMLCRLILKYFNQESVVLIKEYEDGTKSTDFIKIFNI